MVENQRLRAELSETRNDLERLGASLTERRSPVVKEIELTILGAPEEESQELRAVLRGKLQVLVGKDLDEIDPEIVTELFRGVRFKVGENTYTAQPEQIVLARKSFFRLRVTPAGGD